jgi:hypothetical protein
MSKQETMCTRYGEMLDMISCLSIYEGRAEPADSSISHKEMSFDEAIALK